MGNEKNKLTHESKQKLLQILKDILTRVAELEELGAVGNRLLMGFHQGLEFLRRPPMDNASKLIEGIIKANESKRLKSYLEAGSMNSHDGVQNTSKSRSILNNIKCHLEDANVALRAANECPSPLFDNVDKMDQHKTNNEDDDGTSSCLEEPQMTDYVGLIAMIYSMVKQDYMMQEKIVTSLSLKSSPGELECYCLMWSLRPFTNDQIMHQAWRLVT